MESGRFARLGAEKSLVKKSRRIAFLWWFDSVVTVGQTRGWHGWPIGWVMLDSIERLLKIHH